jgi:hypothetical protein
MNKEDFKKRILSIEKNYLTERPNKSDIVKEILRELEKEWDTNDFKNCDD